MTHIKRYLLIFGLLLGLGSAAVATPVGAINVFKDACTAANRDTEVCKAKNDSISPVIETVINTLLFAIGIISVIMIIVGGIRYVTSDGDSTKVKTAKDTILYSIVGLIVAMLAFAIVRFVVIQFG